MIKKEKTKEILKETKKVKKTKTTKKSKEEIEAKKDQDFLMKTKFATTEDIDKYIESKGWRLTAKQYKIPLKILKERPDIVICILNSRSLFTYRDKLIVFLEILLLQKHKKYDTLEKLYNALTIEYEYVKKEEKKELYIAIALISYLMIGLWIWSYLLNFKIMLFVIWSYILIGIAVIYRGYKNRKFLRDTYREALSKYQNN